MHRPAQQLPGIKELVLVALVASVCLTGALESAVHETIFRGRVEGSRVWAVSIGEQADPDDLTSLQLPPDTLLLVYRAYKQFSSVDPSLVYIEDEIKLRYDTPHHTSSGRSIADFIRAANLAGGKKLEVSCQDGTRAEVNGSWDLTRMMSAWGSCRTRGGVGRSFYTTYKDTNAVIACICKDYRLVAGPGDLCGGRAQVLVRIRNREY
jgi:hypothetical protein